MPLRSLKILGLVFVYFVLGIAAFVIWRIDRSPVDARSAMALPIDWKTYSEKAKDAYLENGHNVFVFANPRYAVAPPPESFDSQRVAKLFDNEKFVPMMLQYDDWSGADIRNLFQEVGHTKEAFVVIYVPQKAPTALNAFTFEPYRFWHKK